MPADPRFTSRANAVAASGVIRKHRNQIFTTPLTMPPQAMCSLTVAGGAATSNAPGSMWSSGQGTIVDLGANSAFVEVTASGNTRTTVARATLGRIVVDGRLEVDGMQGEMIASWQPGFQEAEITVGSCHFLMDRIVIDGVAIAVTIDAAVFQQNRSRQALRNAYAGSPQLRQDNFERFNNPNANQTTIDVSRGQHICSIVNGLTPQKALPAGARIRKNHILDWPGFGSIYLGELLISENGRHLTMMRLQLGSPTEGEMAFAASDPDGHD